MKHFLGRVYALQELYKLFLDSLLSKLPFINVAMVGGSDRELKLQVINFMGFNSSVKTFGVVGDSDLILDLN